MQALLSYHFISMEDQQLFFLEEETLSIEKLKRKREVLALEELLSKLVSVTVELQSNMNEMFPKIAERYHYIFTLKNLHRLCRYNF